MIDGECYRVICSHHWICLVRYAQEAPCRGDSGRSKDSAGQFTTEYPKYSWKKLWIMFVTDFWLFCRRSDKQWPIGAGIGSIRGIHPRMPLHLLRYQHLNLPVASEEVILNFYLIFFIKPVEILGFPSISVTLFLHFWFPEKSLH